ncbi:MAG: hypothetical protein QOC89_6119 [Paraburkholderia sp.]|jgi:malic enzyme|uniref:hypothetical protein n=1 Tax=Paraburkholderia sp. TaxID=1926495 RepID=UPI002B0C98DC|nr:hypothetical protein [Paraburkholderia sp.]
MFGVFTRSTIDNVTVPGKRLADAATNMNGAGSQRLAAVRAIESAQLQRQRLMIGGATGLVHFAAHRACLQVLRDKSKVAPRFPSINVIASDFVAR